MGRRLCDAARGSQAPPSPGEVVAHVEAICTDRLNGEVIDNLITCHQFGLLQRVRKALREEAATVGAIAASVPEALAS